MSKNILNDISKVYLEQIATEAAKPDYLDFDKDGNKKESMKKALKDKKEVVEAVRGQDTEMRKFASAERRAGDTLSKKLPPSKGKQFGQYQSDQISYIDKKTKGKHIPGMTRESLDPVGHEDADIDNDGDTDKSDKYLHKRRKAIGKAIATRKESFSDWRQDLSEVMEKIEKDDEHKQIKEKKNINNKVVINPDFKEAVEELGGVLLESVEVDEAYQPIDKDKENRMYRRAGNLARTAVSSTGKKKAEAQKKSSNIVSAITRQKEKERFDRIGQSPAHNEEFVAEKELEEKRGLWDNIHAKRKRGERPARPGEKDYPKTLNVEENELEEGLKQARKNVGASKCWTGKKVGNPPTKMKGGKEVPNCVPEEVEKIDENRAAMRDPENYEREQRRSQSSRERRMNDPKTGINSKAFNDFYNAQMASKKKKANEEYELDEEITSEKGKAKAAEMIAKRSTASGRAKPGQGASVDRIKHISRANVENLSGTPATPTIAKNPVKSRSYGGTGNKAARRAGLTPTREKPNAWKEEFELDEKTLTPAETKKKEEIVKSMKKSAADFEKRYPGRGKEVMYATATKQAKKVAEAVADQAALSPQELQKQKQKAQLDTQIAMLRRQSLAKTEKPQVKEEKKPSALDLVRQSVEKQYGKDALMTGKTKKPKPTAAQKAAAQKASANYQKKTSEYLHSSPRD